MALGEAWLTRPVAGLNVLAHNRLPQDLHTGLQSNYVSADLPRAQRADGPQQS
jgi:hypothetical protein